MKKRAPTDGSENDDRGRAEQKRGETVSLRVAKMD